MSNAEENDDGEIEFSSSKLVSVHRILLLMAEHRLPWERICSIRKILLDWAGLGEGGEEAWLNKKNAAKAANLSEKTFGNAVGSSSVRTRMIGGRLHYHRGDVLAFFRLGEG